nr:hypothetical protein [uncultured Massilia sp.]
MSMVEETGGGTRMIIEFFDHRTKNNSFFFCPGGAHNGSIETRFSRHGSNADGLAKRTAFEPFERAQQEKHHAERT